MEEGEGKILITQKYINELSYMIIGCAIEVHRNLGPGLLESVYEQCFMYELKNAGLNAKNQLSIPLYYKDLNLNGNLRLDIIVNDIILVENKAVEEMIPLYRAQLLSYLKLA